MGFGSNGKKVLFNIEICHADLVDIGNDRLRKDHADAPTSTRPTVIVDANNIANIVGRKSGDVAVNVANHLVDMAHRGMIVIPICDGASRPISKQSSNKSRATRVKNKNDAIINRQLLRDINKQLEECGNETERIKLSDTRKKIERKIKSAETQSINVVPPQFDSILQDVLNKQSAHTPNEVGGGYVSRVHTAEFQADSLMCGIYLSKGCQLIESNDADYVIFLGDNCIAIKEYTNSRVILSSTSKATLEDAVSCLSDESKKKVKWTCPKHPIFEGITDMKTRILIAVIIGCDVCPGGVGGIGPQKVEEKMKQISDMPEVSIYEALMKWAVEFQLTYPKKTDTPQYNRETITAYVYGVIYEPTNEISTPLTFMQGKPNKLPKYLEQFKSPTTVIEEGPEILKCKGSCCNSSHNFLAAVTHHTCPVCKEIVCNLCCAKLDTGDKKKKIPHCQECYLMESVLPGGATAMEAELTISQMREELKNRYNFDHADQLSIDAVEDLYVEYTLHRYLEEIAENVEFPKFPASAIKSGENWKEIGTIDFNFGGAFLLDDNLDEKYLPGILELFASFVKFGSEDKKHTDWKKDGAVYSAMPEMFIKLSNKCRVDLGYRLLRRCLRHAFDVRTESLDNKTAKLILYDGDKVGIEITTPIPASMKKDVYDGTTVLTKDELLATECGCMSGAKNGECRACIHVLPRGFLLSILLSEDLAQHMLLELTSMVTSAEIETDNWTPEQIASMKSSALILMEASGESTLAKEVAPAKTLYEMLHSYRTGTQKTKEWNRVHKPPKEDEIGCIEDIIFDSPEQKAKVLLNRSSPKANLDPTEEVVKFDPDYVKTGHMLNAAGIFPSSYDVVGFELLTMRRDKQPCDRDADAGNVNDARSEWKELLLESEKRSTRRSASQISNLQQQMDSPTPSKKRKKYGTRAVVEKKRSHPSGYSPSKKCAKKGCKSTSDTKGISFHRIPPYTEDAPADASLKVLITNKLKQELRAEATDRVGKGRNCSLEDLRVCSCHKFETITKEFSVTKDDTTYKQKCELTVVTGDGVRSSSVPSETSKGSAYDRYKTNQLNFLHDNISSPSATVPPNDEKEHERNMRLLVEAQSEAASAKLAMQQIVECHSPDSISSIPICPTVSKGAGLVESKLTSNLQPIQMRKFKVTRIGRPYKQKPPSPISKKRKKYELNVDKPPSVLTTEKASEVKRRTGFTNATHLIAYVITICNGDVNRIRTRKSPLTWFEEWFLYLEWKWHETNRRQIDLESKWGLDNHQLNDVKDCKGALDMAAVLSWPRFASYEEDFTLREQHHPKKWSRYDGKRPIEWDMTSVAAVAFSDASLQRATFSDYYGMNCFKGGVGIQLCGWVVNDDLWGGGVSDTDYNKRAGYLQAQQDFVETDLVGGKKVKFLNILDRGYRGSMAAWQSGEQVTLQPPSAKSDARFKGKQTIFAGCIARDRSGNERGVNVCKRTGLVSRGFRQGTSAKRFNRGWRTWSFQANFMFKPVL